MARGASHRRVLIIAYYWPPSGGSGVQRWHKFAKYLPSNGWSPVVYTPSNPEYPALDPSLESEVPDSVEVIRRPILEPYALYRRFMGMDRTQTVGTRLPQARSGAAGRHGLSMWIRGNLFIPDPRASWVRPSVRFLARRLRREPVDAIVTTGPPHSMHLIGLGLADRGFGPWIADFRDPWTRIDYFEELRLTRAARNRHLSLERRVLERADAVVVTSPGTARMFRELAPCDPVVITNGYDPADFTEAAPPRKEGVTLVHVGMLDRMRHHPLFWQALERFIRENPERTRSLRIRLIGSVDPAIRRDLEGRPGLAGRLEFAGYLTHAQSVAEMRAADLLLSFIAQAPNSDITIPGKLFEYMAAGPEILHLDRPGSDASALLARTGAGVSVDFSDPEAILRALDGLMKPGAESKPGSAPAKTPVPSKHPAAKRTDAPMEADTSVAYYSRTATAGRLARLLDSLAEESSRSIRTKNPAETPLA